MTVRAEISEADIVKVKPGQSLYFTILGDQDHRYEARLEQIEPAPESIKSDASFSSTTTTSSSSSSSSSSDQHGDLLHRRLQRPEQGPFRCEPT